MTLLGIQSNVFLDWMKVTYFTIVCLSFDIRIGKCNLQPKNRSHRIDLMTVI